MNPDGPSKFCVLTTGRTGSTSLMDALARFDDIALPSKDINCPFNELLHHQFVAEHANEYSQLCNREIGLTSELVECFFQLHADARFAGFKSMPKRRKEYVGYLNDPDVRRITLIRRDIASTAASFLQANTRGAWRRRGETPPTRWTFRQADANLVLSTVVYVHRTTKFLANIRGAIQLAYEDLCRTDFCNTELDEFFDRPIRLQNPRPPTSGADYVTNWDEFHAFVADTIRRFDQGLLKRRPSRHRR